MEMVARSPSRTWPKSVTVRRSADHVRRVRAAQHRVQEEPVGQPVDPPGGVGVGRARRAGDDRVEVERHADLGVPAGRPAAPATASPWPSIRWCAARTAAGAVGAAGGVVARSRSPRNAEHHGSLSVVQCCTRSPSASCDERARSRRTGRRCPGPASRRRPPAPAAGPSGRGSATARCRGPAARRPAAGRSPGPAGLTGPLPPGCTRDQDTENRYDFEPELGHQRDVVAEAVVVVAGHVAGVRRRRPGPGVWLKVSQIEGVRPSSAAAPSIWYAAVAAPQRNPGGKVRRRWLRSTHRAVGWASSWSRLDGTFHDAADDLAAEHDENEQQGKVPAPCRRRPRVVRVVGVARGSSSETCTVGLSG